MIIRIFIMSGEREKLDARLEKNRRISLSLRTNWWLFFLFLCPVSWLSCLPDRLPDSFWVSACSLSCLSSLIACLPAPILNSTEVLTTRRQVVVVVGVVASPEVQKSRNLLVKLLSLCKGPIGSWARNFRILGSF